MSTTPKTMAATTALLELSTSLGVSCGEAAEAFTRCLFSVALDVANGDNEIAVAWVDQKLIPMIATFRNHLVQGGTTVARISNGQKLNG